MSVGGKKLACGLRLGSAVFIIICCWIRLFLLFQNSPGVAISTSLDSWFTI